MRAPPAEPAGRRGRRAGGRGAGATVLGLLAALLAALLAPPGAGGAHGRQGQRPQGLPPPRLVSLFPDKGHTVGGTLVTLHGSGFRRGTGLTVRFSHSTGEVDEVPGEWLDSSRIRALTPFRDDPHVAHVSVANDAVSFSSYPLVTDVPGGHLSFTFVNTEPTGHWVVDNATGPVDGGTLVTIDARESMTSTRLLTGAFLPGRCQAADFRGELSKCLPEGSYGEADGGAVLNSTGLPSLPKVDQHRIKHLGHSTAADPQGVGAFARGLRCRFGNTPNSTQSVEAEWVSYGRLRCRTPPWDGFTDDDPHLGGYQVTVFITNDAQLFVPGTQAPGNASVQTPKGYPAADVPGTGVTFTYFGDEPFRDAHTFKGSGIDDIEVYGEYRGDGVGFFEVQVDGLAPDTYRWRFHPGEYNASSTADWPDHRLQVPTGEAFELATGISAAFLNGETTGSQDCEVRESMFYGLYGLSMGGFENGARSGGCRSVGDTWVFRVCGGRPAVYRISTPHREKAVAARGPFEGNTEVTLHGNHFLPSWHLQCQLQDPLTGAKLFVPGHYDTARRIRCVTPRVEPLPGGEKLATIRPCFYKYFSASSSAGPWERWSTASAAVRFLYCDVYVATDGSDLHGHGTPDRPYGSIAHAVSRALMHPRSFWAYKSGLATDPGSGKAYTGREIRGPGQGQARKVFGKRGLEVAGEQGLGYWVNRDRVVLADGVYGGAENTGLLPGGRVVEVVAKRRGEAVIDCTGTGNPAVFGSHSGGDTSRGAVLLSGVPTLQCDQDVYYPSAIRASSAAYPAFGAT